MILLQAIGISMCHFNIAHTGIKYHRSGNTRIVRNGNGLCAPTRVSAHSNLETVNHLIEITAGSGRLPANNPKVVYWAK